MKNKKILFLLVGVLIIILITLFFIIKNFKIEDTDDLTDYTPQEEISSSGLRETIVTLYFVDNSTGELKSTGKHIDSVQLIENPYQKLVELLLESPQEENTTSIFPTNTQILNASLTEDCAVLNFSNELLSFTDDTQKFNIINGLLNTLTTLNEVNSIKILVNDTLPDGFEEKYTISSINKF